MQESASSFFFSFRAAQLAALSSLTVSSVTATSLVSSPPSSKTGHCQRRDRGESSRKQHSMPLRSSSPRLGLYSWDGWERRRRRIGHLPGAVAWRQHVQYWQSEAKIRSLCGAGRRHNALVMWGVEGVHLPTRCLHPKRANRNFAVVGAFVHSSGTTKSPVLRQPESTLGSQCMCRY